jgi:hypothetical protein
MDDATDHPPVVHRRVGWFLDKSGSIAAHARSESQYPPAIALLLLHFCKMEQELKFVSKD